ncbi:MAG: response regulator [Spirochaetaceae bacterium]|nr:response regulator [Spirochaetaceae bacterium]
MHVGDSDLRYDALFKTMEIGILVARLEERGNGKRDLRLIEANAALEELFSLSDGLLIGRFLGDLLPPDRRDAIDRIIAATRGSVKPADRAFDIQLGSADYHVVPYAPAPGFVALTVEDITARLVFERELEAAKKTAEDALEVKGRFLSNMSHEIRNPLNGILGMASLLEHAGVSPEQKILLGNLIASGELLRDTVSGILDLVSLETRQWRIELGEFAIVPFLESLAETHRPGAAQKGLSLELSIAADLPPVLVGDPKSLRHLLDNLLSNAVKFTDKGSVTLLAAPDGGGAGDPERVLSFEVRDTGIGIEGDKAAALFERFGQLDASYTKRFAGTGLGLSLVKQLVEVMGGSVAVRSELGKGSSFILRLPFSVAQAASAIAAEPRGKASPGGAENPGGAVSEKGSGGAGGAGAAVGGARRLEVLVAEDNSVNRLYLEKILRREACDVVATRDGREALLRYMDKPYDLIFLDVQMPEMDGITCSALIRERERGRGLSSPIIGMSGYSSEADLGKCRAAGMDGVLVKPINAREVERIVALAGEDRGALRAYLGRLAR